MRLLYPCSQSGYTLSYVFKLAVAASNIHREGDGIYDDGSRQCRHVRRICEYRWRGEYLIRSHIAHNFSFELSLCTVACFIGAFILLLSLLWGTSLAVWSQYCTCHSCCVLINLCWFYSIGWFTYSSYNLTVMLHYLKHFGACANHAIWAVVAGEKFHFFSVWVRSVKNVLLGTGLS